jgi:hypothetical protein
VSSRACPKSGCVADELSVDDVGEASFEAAQRFSVALSGSAFSSVVGPPRGLTGDLSDGHRVQAAVVLDAL